MKTAHLLSRKCAVGVLLILTSENRASDQINLRVSITVDVGNVVIFLFPKLLEDISLAYLSCS